MLLKVFLGLLVIAAVIMGLAIYVMVGITAGGTGERPMDVFKRFVKEALGRY